MQCFRTLFWHTRRYWPSFYEPYTSGGQKRHFTMSAQDVVVVTGGSGFLGQHIIHLLQSKDETVREIRVLDLKPYVNRMGHKEEKPVKCFLGDIRNYTNVKSAFKGANSVMHIAGLVSFGTFPDIKGMEEVNITGTSNVIKACIEENIPRLIFCSTVDVVIGYEDIDNGTEISTSVPKKFLFPGYPETKHTAETMVTKANGARLADGGALRTISLRPNVMYGEEDPYLVTNALKNAKRMGGTVLRIGNGKSLFQQAYAGNVAWAFVVANQKLAQAPSIGGHCFFVPDNTPVRNIFESLTPYLTDRGFKLSSFSIPYWLIHVTMIVVEFLLWIISPLIKINMQTPLCSITYINMTLCFRNDKAKTLLGYEPLFSEEDARSRSMKYYHSLEL